MGAWAASVLTSLGYGHLVMPPLLPVYLSTCAAASVH